MTASSGVESIGQNVRGLLTHAERLARTEVELALAKGRESVGETARHLIMIVVAGVFALGGTAFLLYAIFCGVQTRVDTWLAALLTAGVAFVGAVLFLRLGVQQKSAPEVETTDGVRRDRVMTAR